MDLNTNTDETHDQDGATYIEGYRPLNRGAACLPCRKKRAKCNAGRPECERCQKNGDQCRYELPPKTPMVELRERMDQMEENNRALRAQIAAALGPSGPTAAPVASGSNVLAPSLQPFIISDLPSSSELAINPELTIASYSGPVMPSNPLFEQLPRQSPLHTGANATGSELPQQKPPIQAQPASIAPLVRSKTPVTVRRKTSRRERARTNSAKKSGETALIRGHTRSRSRSNIQLATEQFQSNSHAPAVSDMPSENWINFDVSAPQDLSSTPLQFPSHVLSKPTLPLEGPSTSSFFGLHHHQTPRTLGHARSKTYSGPPEAVRPPVSHSTSMDDNILGLHQSSHPVLFEPAPALSQDSERMQREPQQQPLAPGATYEWQPVDAMPRSTPRYSLGTIISHMVNSPETNAMILAAQAQDSLNRGQDTAASQPGDSDTMMDQNFSQMLFLDPTSTIPLAFQDDTSNVPQYQGPPPPSQQRQHSPVVGRARRRRGMPSLIGAMPSTISSLSFEDDTAQLVPPRQPYDPRWMNGEEPTPFFQAILIDLFLAHRRQCASEFNITRFQVNLHGPLHARPTSGFLNAMFLLGCWFAYPWNIHGLEPIFLKKARQGLAISLKNEEDMLGCIQCSGLITLYLYGSGMMLEGYKSLAGAVALAMVAGLDNIESHIYTEAMSVEPPILPTHEPPIGNLRYKTFFLKQPLDAVELGDRIHAFWSIWILDASGSATHGFPRKFNDSQVLTQFPLPIEWYSNGQAMTVNPETLARFWETEAICGTREQTTVTLRIKATSLLEACTTMGQIWGARAMDRATNPINNEFESRYQHLYRTCHNFREQLPGTQGTSALGGEVTEDWITSQVDPVMVHVWCLTLCSQIRLNHIKAPFDEQAYFETLEASGQIVKIINEVLPLNFLQLDIMIGMAWMSAASTLTSHLSNPALPQNFDEQQVFAITNDIEIISSALRKLGGAYPLVLYQADLVDETLKAALSENVTGIMVAPGTAL